jgi:ParB-like nuclease family protein
MPMTGQDMLPAHDLEDRILREDTEEISVLETDSAIRDAHEGIPAQGMDNERLDASLHECRVEMVPLDDIYVGSDLQDDDLVNALAHSIGLVGLQNPICVVENDLPDHAASYRLVSGKKRLAAVIVQLMKTEVTLQLATSGRLRGAETERVHHTALPHAPP